MHVELPVAAVALPQHQRVAVYISVLFIFCPVPVSRSRANCCCCSVTCEYNAISPPLSLLLLSCSIFVFQFKFCIFVVICCRSCSNTPAQIMSCLCLLDSSCSPRWLQKTCNHTHLSTKQWYMVISYIKCLVNAINVVTTRFHSPLSAAFCCEHSSHVNVCLKHVNRTQP